MTGFSEMLKTSLWGLSTPTLSKNTFPWEGKTYKIQEQPSEELSSNCTGPEGQGNLHEKTFEPTLIR